MQSHQKPIILTFTSFYLPGFRGGGPIRSISNLVKRLADEFDLPVITGDCDLGTVTPYQGINIDKWNLVDGCKVFYVSENDISISKILYLILEQHPDVIHLNSFFDFKFTQRVVWAKRLGRLKSLPICIAPKGEFSKGALAQKRWKKKLFIALTRIAGLYKGVHWHASSDLEAADIRRALPWVKLEEISIALNLAPLPDVRQARTSRRPPIADELVIAFLSRIVPKKNLSFALKVLAKVGVPVRLLVYGPLEDDAYWIVCEALMQQLPPNVQVEYKGIVLPHEVLPSLTQADLFFFPTLGENYGHVIHEALSAGLPVLLSDQTPWAKVVDNKVGWVYPLGDVQPYVQAIESYWALGVEARAAMADRAIAYGDEVSRNDGAVQDHSSMFNKLVLGHPRLANKAVAIAEKK